MVVLLTALLHRRAVPQSQRWALLLSYLGIGLVFVNAPGSTASPDMILGATFVFASAFAYALYLTGSGQIIPRFGSRHFTAYSMSVACVLTIAHFSLTSPLEQLAVSPRVLGLALALAVISTVIPAFLMVAGIRRIGADQAAIVGTVGPVSTLVMAYLVLGEGMGAVQIIGSAMVLSGVLLVTAAKRRPPLEPSTAEPTS